MSSNTTILEGLAGNPASAEMAVVTATASAVALSATTTVWNGGIWISNADATSSVFVGLTGVTAAAGVNRMCVGPGQCLPFTLSRKLTEIFIISSGTPLVTYAAAAT